LGALHPKTSVEEVVSKAIRLGEGEMIEFKPYIALRSEKQNELITTAIAFSNTKGGAILIGVDNHCLIKGIEKDLRKASRHHEQGIEQALQEYIGSVRQTIGGGVTRTMVLEISQLEIQGHRVVVVQVPEGTEKPYANVLTKAIHIRRGANNVIPDPDTELPQLLSRYLVENMPFAPSQIHRI